MNNLSVSVIIVSWNHRSLLPDCLEALLDQGHCSFDVTVVDNGSQDGSPAWVARRYPDLQLKAFSTNQGFSRAFNWGVHHTSGDLILSLNPDTVVKDRFMAEIVQAAIQDAGAGMVAPKLLRADEPTVLDSTGLFVDRRRRPYDRGQGEPDCGQYDTSPIGPASLGLRAFGGCGAAVLYQRAMLEDVAPDGEFLDESFFAYCEDADLAWRAQLRGWHCAYAPRAVAAHARGWGDTLRKARRRSNDVNGPRLALRNRYLMAFKNDALAHFLRDLPLVLMAELPRLAYATFARPAVLLGLADLARALPSAMRRRRETRSRRTVDDAVIRRWFVAPLEMAIAHEE